jgi:uncharacterized protein (DUF1330 family)
MSSFKKLSKADVTTVPYAANKRWSLTYNGGGVPNDSYAVFSLGFNTPFDKKNGQRTTNSQYASLIYSQINHLFYQSFTSSLNTGSLMFNVNTYQSASQNRPTASYFNYNTNPLLIKQFPSSSGNSIGVLSINQDIYGSKILPTSFQISSSGILIKDDGNGNLYDVSQAQNQFTDLNYITLNYIKTGSLIESGIFFVGNIFYAHGLSIITIQNNFYLNSLNPSCGSYILTGGNTDTTFQLYLCGDTTPTTIEVIAGEEITVCINDNYPIIILSGDGGANEVDPCTIPVNLSFQNEHIIYENEINCIVKESDYNLTYNPTLLKYGGQYITSGSNGYTLTGSLDTTVKDFATGSAFQPYVTTIGLYNDENELLMVAKLAKPIVLSPDTDMTFIVKYDT